MKARLATIVAVVMLASAYLASEATAGEAHSFSGKASYYGYSGKVASGGQFNPNGLTAAHRTLPFGTHVRVTDPKTGRSVIVTINDRGPFGRGASSMFRSARPEYSECWVEALSSFKPTSYRSVKYTIEILRISSIGEPNVLHRESAITVAPRWAQSRAEQRRERGANEIRITNPRGEQLYRWQRGV